MINNLRPTSKRASCNRQTRTRWMWKQAFFLNCIIYGELELRLSLTRLQSLYRWICNSISQWNDIYHTAITQVVTTSMQSIQSNYTVVPPSFTMTGWTVRSSNPSRGELFLTVQNSPQAYPPCNTMGTGSFARVLQPRHGIDHPPLSGAKVQGRVQLYLYSRSVPSRHVIGQTQLLLPSFAPKTLYVSGASQIHTQMAV